MKNIMMKPCLMCSFMLVAAAPLLAETEVVNGIEWTYRIVKDKAEICKSGGPAIPTSTTGAITIPSKLGGKPVTSIGRFAFSNCENLTSVKIPAGVTQIGPHSFACCRGLTNVVIPAGVTRIEDSAFDHCRGLTSVVIPAGVTRIGNSAFEGCDKLTSISIPNSVTNIGKKAFSGCRGVKSYFVTDDNPNYKFTNGMLLTKDGISIIATIGELKSIKIPDGVKYIDDGIFSFRDDISSVELPNSITDIGKQAFYRCGKLTNITIPNSVVSIEDRAFEDCGRLENITIPNSVTNIGNYAFSGCRSLMSIMIPNSVISIGGAAFSRCSGLKSFAIADDNRKYKFANGLLLTKDGTALAWATGALTRVKVPDGVEYISNVAFVGCDRLTSVTIPKSVTLLLGGTFSKCIELKSLEVDKDNTKYRSVNGLILTKDGTTLVEAAGGLTSSTIPDGVSCVGVGLCLSPFDGSRRTC